MIQKLCVGLPLVSARYFYESIHVVVIFQVFENSITWAESIMITCFGDKIASVARCLGVNKDFFPKSYYSNVLICIVKFNDAEPVNCSLLCLIHPLCYYRDQLAAMWSSNQIFWTECLCDMSLYEKCLCLMVFIPIPQNPPWFHLYKKSQVT